MNNTPKFYTASSNKQEENQPSHQLMTAQNFRSVDLAEIPQLQCSIFI